MPAVFPEGKGGRWLPGGERTPMDAGQPQEAASWDNDVRRALLMGSYLGGHLRGNSLLLVKIPVVLLCCLWDFAFA